MRELGYRPKITSTLRVRVKHSLADYNDHGLTTTQFLPVRDGNLDVDAEHVEAFASLMDQRMHADRPDVVLMYGGRDMGRAILNVARSHDVPAVFWLRNASYQLASLFETASGILVDSEFIKDHYRKTIGLDCTAIPSPIDWDRVKVPDDARDPNTLTFVTPVLAKGLYVAARIFEQVLVRLPDLRIQIVEGRGSAEHLFTTGAEIPRANVDVVKVTPDPRAFYARTRVLLAPSVWAEAFLRVAVEGMINGIPTLASDRGDIPTTLADAGQTFSIPSRLTEHTKVLPTKEEVQSWVDAIVRLWKNDAHYAEERERCLRAREAYAWERLSQRYVTYFNNIISASSRG